MGLIYILPVKEDERDDRVSKDDHGITLKSYGLPMIFWGYLCAILVVISVMALAVREPLRKLLLTEDFINILLGLAAISTMVAIPLVLFCLFFYEKWITKKGKTLTIIHRLFWLPFYKKTHHLKSQDSFELKHFLDSPNVARMQKKPELRGFENQGYFEAYFEDENGNKHLLDRNPRKADLKKIADLLSKY